MNRPTIFISIALASGALTTMADDARHEFDISGRMRFADLHSGNDDGKSGTTLLRASVKSKWHENIETFAELDHVVSTHDDQFDNGVTLNGKPFLPDVEGSDINQLFLQFNRSALTVVLGRQSIELDNQRFIGGNGFWQNEQTFDAGSIDYAIFSSSHASYTFIDNANRIFGQDATPDLRENNIGYTSFEGLRPTSLLGDHNHDTHLARFEMNEWDYSQLVFYAYFINNKDLPSTSNDSFGVSYSIKYKPSLLHYRIELEAALQDRSNVPAANKIPYTRLDFGLGYKSFEFSAQYESLGAKQDTPFITPLGSTHEFNGWADEFGTAPSGGLVDQSLKITWRAAPWKFDVRAHRFENKDNGIALGTEFDFDISFEPHKKHEVLLRFARFTPSTEQEDARNDTKRVILTYSYNF